MGWETFERWGQGLASRIGQSSGPDLGVEENLEAEWQRTVIGNPDTTTSATTSVANLEKEEKKE